MFGYATTLRSATQGRGYIYNDNGSLRTSAKGYPRRDHQEKWRQRLIIIDGIRKDRWGYPSGLFVIHKINFLNRRSFYRSCSPYRQFLLDRVHRVFLRYVLNGQL